MTYEEFRRQLGRAGLSARQFAELLQMNPNSVSNYASTGAIPAHLAVIAALMADLAEHDIDFRKTVSAIEVQPKKPRGCKNNVMNKPRVTGIVREQSGNLGAGD